MSAEENKAYLSLAESLARKVGERLLPALLGDEKTNVHFKDEFDLVTDLDRLAEEIITTGIKECFPTHNVMGEENYSTKSFNSSTVSSGFWWVLDPIDGTTNFVHGIPHVGVSIALLENGVRKLGVVFDPARDEMFSAVLGKGAKLNSQPIKPRGVKEIKKSLIATGYPHGRIKAWPQLKPIYDTFFEEARDIRIGGAAVLDQCWVACGRLEGFFEMNLQPWDVAAASLIVEEAGGFAGNPVEENGSEFDSFSKSFLFTSTKEMYEQIASKLNTGNL